MGTPRSTYRLQITEEFDLLAAAHTLPYLHDLGVDWVYLSPLLASESGSEHGYDVSDHRAIDPARGRGSGLSALSAEARRLGMGVLVDIVPNHVGIARPWENPWWWHVLTHGQDSPYAMAFDIDWDFGGGRVRIPVVGDDDVRLDGSIANLRVEAGELHYYDLRFPLAPGSAGPGDEERPDAVHARQHYELIGWRRADAELNYRRFFAVNTLAAVRVEDPQWFAATHEEIGRWFTDDLVDGLRIDHPDGLRDPGKYLDDLAELTGGAYVLVEKILAPGEELPREWATAGTTGYDVLALIDRVLTDPAGEGPLTELERALRGSDLDWPQLTHDSKRTVADTELRAEVRRIARDLHPLLLPSDGAGPATEDVEDAVAEVLATFGVYRTYLPLGREHLDAAMHAARARAPHLAETLDILEPVLGDGAAEGAARFQQTSGMVMAKGVEDCAFYRTSRLTSLTEVGADPSVFAVPVAAFHAAMAVRQEHWPEAMTAASTHDTKRGEDVRARIAVLAEHPHQWARLLTRLLDLTPMPDPNLANLMWQTILGAWPLERERAHTYAEKAMRESGEHTTWTRIDERFEAAVHAALDAAFDDPAVADTLAQALDLIVEPGWSNALSAKLIGLTMPGVPDIYQGAELWEQSLVDPDNRRPVDFDARRASLEAIDGSRHPSRPVGLDDAGATKLHLVHRALTLRRDRPDLFTGYTPLSATGPAADHLLAFDRGGAVTLATRLPVGLAGRGGWGQSAVALPAGRYRDELTGAVHDANGDPVALADLLAELPIALLVRLPEQVRERGLFDVWAPNATRLRLSIGEDIVPMRPIAGDWWTPDAPLPAQAGTANGGIDYGFLIDDDERVLPDPRSRRQPGGVHARSRTWDPRAYAWTDGRWRARPLSGSVLYELHVGTFTSGGTLDSAVERLDHLVELGIDAVELMPVNAFNGEYGWGYDAVAWFAVHEAYGGPEAYQRFVDACHARGLAVIQDVVYNHLGPSGNYLPRFGPYLKEGRSAWGELVNLDREGSGEVRRFILDAATAWFTDFHVDGLRLDAVHAFADDSPVHLLEELSVQTAALAAQLRRPLMLIAESDLNDPVLVLPRIAGGLGIDAQWSDDFHHGLRVALTGDIDGYYADFAPLSALAKAYQEGFFHAGTWSSFRGRDHGRPLHVDTFPAWKLLAYSQNHDQVGNRARGERLTAHLDLDQLALAALLTLTSPYTPMLFAGEEFAASTPFPFFTSHPEPELAAAVREGRFVEFEAMGWDRASVPDPQDPATYVGAHLDWAQAADPVGNGARLLEAYRGLIRIRRELPALTDPDLREVDVHADDEARTMLIRRGSGAHEVVVAANFSAEPATVDLGELARYRLAWHTPSGASLTGSTLRLPRHGGAVAVVATR
ncbi:MAG: malto-oligosyltrehalose synthase [Nostocoides sp.]